MGNDGRAEKAGRKHSLGWDSQHHSINIGEPSAIRRKKDLTCRAMSGRWMVSRSRVVGRRVGALAVYMHWSEASEMITQKRREPSWLFVGVGARKMSNVCTEIILPTLVHHGRSPWW